MVISMKRTLSCLSAILLFCFGCNRPSQDIATPQDVQMCTTAAETITLDSVSFVVNNDDLDEEGNPKYPEPPLRVNVHYPSIKEHPLLANAVMEWICEQACPNYRGAMDISAMFQSLQDQSEDACCQDYEVKLIYETDRLVTFLMTGSFYSLGAAHGTTVVQGATFRKSDGKIFGDNLFKMSRIDNELLQKGLMEYFEVSSPYALTEELMLDESHSIIDLPQPTSLPWVTEKGIDVLYQQYEICCYAAGMPSFVIPFDEAKPYLSAPAWSLLGLDE